MSEIERLENARDEWLRLYLLTHIKAERARHEAEALAREAAHQRSEAEMAQRKIGCLEKLKLRVVS